MYIQDWSEDEVTKEYLDGNNNYCSICGDEIDHKGMCSDCEYEVYREGCN